MSKYIRIISGKLCKVGEGLSTDYYVKCDNKTIDLKTEFNKMYSDNTSIYINISKEEEDVSR